MTTMTNMTNEMIKYRIKFKIDGKTITWERSCCEGMEACLQGVKDAINIQFAGKQIGGIAICGPQCGTDIYNF